MTLEEFERRQAEAAARGESVFIDTVIEDLAPGPLGCLAGLLMGADPEPEPEIGL